MKYHSKVVGWLFTAVILLSISTTPIFAERLKKSDSLSQGQPAAVVTEVMKKSEKEKILSRIRQKYSLKEAYVGSFTQKTTYTDSNETTLSTGRIWIQGPDKMRWEYQLPEKQLLVSDGQTLWYYTPDLNQVMVGKIKDIKEARVIVNLLAKLKSEPKNLRLELSRSGNRITVVLLPQNTDKSPAFQNLKIIFAADTLMLQETQMEDLFANKIVITYKWQSGPDPVLPAAHFNFIPPTGCDVMPLGQ